MVLIVEDEADVLVLAESILAEEGYETLSAANADEALALLDGVQQVDVLFTDITMPGTDGIELARRAAEARPKLRVIYTTGGAVTDGTRALFVDGATLLPKPYTREELLAMVGGR